jgi:hypothetical protein
VREEDATDSDDERQGMRLETPPLLPPRLLAKWQEKLKAEAVQEPPTEPTEPETENTNSEDEYPTPREIAAQMANEAPPVQSTEEVPAAAKEGSGVPVSRKR